MKIAFCSYVSLFSRAYQYGGTEIWLSEMARRLAQKKHEVHIYTPPLTFGGRAAELADHMKGIPYSEAWRQKVSADVAYIYYYSPLAWRVFFSLDCPKVAGLHAPGLLSKNSPRHYLFKMLGSRDLASFDAVRVVSPIFEFEHPRVFHIPDVVDTQAFAFQQNGSGRFTLLFVGRRQRERRWDDFVKVASKLKREGYDFDYIATGEGNELVSGLGNVSHEDMPEVYSRAHVLLHPAVTDTFGLAIVEALCCGILVITTPIPAHASLGAPLFYAQSADEFAQQVVKVYEGWRNNPEWYQGLRHSLRESILKYDINNIFPQLENMLESVANQGRKAK